MVSLGYWGVLGAPARGMGNLGALHPEDAGYPTIHTAGGRGPVGGLCGDGGRGNAHGVRAGWGQGMTLVLAIIYTIGLVAAAVVVCRERWQLRKHEEFQDYIRRTYGKDKDDDPGNSGDR